MGYREQIEDELMEGEKRPRALGDEVPLAQVLHAPLRRAPEIFQEPSLGSRKRIATKKRELGAKVDQFSDTDWLEASLGLDIAGWDSRRRSAWRSAGPWGPGGDVLDVVAQAVHIRQVAERLERLVATPTVVDDLSLDDWAARLFRASSSLDPATAIDLGLESLLEVNRGVAYSLALTARTWGALRVARTLGVPGHPPAIPGTVFVWWLRAAGATPTQIAAINHLTGTGSARLLSAEADRIGKVQEEAIGQDELNPARYLASMALQEVAWADGRAESSISALPPLLGVQAGAAPAMEQERDWLWVPVPAGILPLIGLLAPKEPSDEG